MALLTTISGLRGTIGGVTGENFTPIDVVQFVSGFVDWVRETENIDQPFIVVGGDIRPSFEIYAQLVSATVRSKGAHVTYIGHTTTPTLGLYVTQSKAHAGIMLSASHNDKEWNALKLFNRHGLYLDAQEMGTYLSQLKTKTHSFSPIEKLGMVDMYMGDALKNHIDAILQLPLVNVAAIREANFKILYDSINSFGHKAIEKLFFALGVEDFLDINNEMDGNFRHNPEPLAENLTELCKAVVYLKKDIGIAVDPDVDRLALVCGDGSWFGEENTIVAVADYVLSHQPGHVVSNLSSSRALRDIALVRNSTYSAAPVGEINVINEMKATQAVIGGEGNGGVIYPPLRYGRDALVGIALILSYLATAKLTLKQLKARYPDYVMIKHKVELPAGGLAIHALTSRLQAVFPDGQLDTRDGIKIDMPDYWLHLRASNTEPILRIYAEGLNHDQLTNAIQQVQRIVETA
jgi:phosphomannomutase